MFIELSCIIANVISIKYRKFNQLRVSVKEVMFIKKLLQKEYDNNKIDAIIVDKIDNYYFKVCNEVIYLNDINNVTLWEIEGNLKYIHEEYFLSPKSTFLYNCIKNYKNEIFF